jgi:two-component system sensor histidine kinase VicK
MQSGRMADTDITERTEAERALQRARDELETCVQQRTAELACANDELRREIEEHRRTEKRLQDAIRRLNELDQARLRLVSDVSHELKTPLASLRFEIDNMLKGYGGTLSESCQAYMVMIKSDVERLIRTVQSVLDMGRIEAHALVLSPSRVPADDLIRQSVESLKLHAEAKQQQLEMTLDDSCGTVEWDTDKIGQVVNNIVENAIKYTHPGGVVRVSLKPDGAHPGLVVLEVVDNGIGIPPEHIHRVGERYFRVGEQVNGSGLGLSIAKEIVQLHGGWLQLKSPPEGTDRGTQVSLFLPYAPSAPGVGTTSPSPSR